jgi:DNA repair protein RadA/Sms
MWECFQCHSRFSKCWDNCPGCGRRGTIRALAIEQPNNNYLLQVQANLPPARTIAELRRERLTIDKSIPEKVSKAFGWLPPRWSMVVWGCPGSGKSSLASVLAEELGRQDYKVLYVSAEENQHNVIQRFMRLELKSPWVTFSFARDSVQLLQDLDNDEGGCDFSLLIIDSLSVMNLDLGRLSLWVDKRDLSIITLSHATKDGKPQGSSRLLHDVDVVVEVASLEWSVTKNRFGPLTRGPINLSTCETV